MAFEQITAPEDLATSLTFLQQVAAGQIDAAAWEKRYVRKDGSYTWVRTTLSLQCDMAGRPIHHIAVVEDINARKAAADALRKAEQQYREIFEVRAGRHLSNDEGGQCGPESGGGKVLGFASPGDGGRRPLRTRRIGMARSPGARPIHPSFGGTRRDRSIPVSVQAQGRNVFMGPISRAQDLRAGRRDALLPGIHRGHYRAEGDGGRTWWQRSAS